MKLLKLPVSFLAGVAFVVLALVTVKVHGQIDIDPPTEAPTGFDNQSNGLVEADRHQSDRDAFEEVEGIGDGLGPVYNGRSCGECHQNPTTGAISQVRELRAGHRDGSGNFV